MPAKGAGDVLSLLTAHPRRFNSPRRSLHLTVNGKVGPRGGEVWVAANQSVYLRVFHLDAEGSAALICSAPSVLRAGREEVVGWDPPQAPGNERLILLASARRIEEKGGLLPGLRPRGNESTATYFIELARLMRSTPAGRGGYAVALATLTRDPAGRAALTTDADSAAAVSPSPP